MSGGRIRREKKTVAKMVAVYCRHAHGTRREPCAECRDLLAYAHARLDRCPFGNAKPTCGQCHVHCYRPTRRERIRDVMRTAGPRMLREHPVLGALHLWDALLGALRKRPRRATQVGEGTKANHE